MLHLHCVYYGPLPPIAFLYIPMRHGTADGKVVGQISSTLKEKVPDSQWRGRMFESYLQMQQIYVFQHRLRIGIQKGVGVPDF